jgi:hypothetical protein
VDDVALANVPVPLVVQRTEAALVDPPVSEYGRAVVHTTPSAPADTIGAPVIVRTISSDTFEQVPKLLAVRVRVTEPNAISATLGV